jgi:hypothetical protein
MLGNTETGSERDMFNHDKIFITVFTLVLV